MLLFISGQEIEVEGTEFPISKRTARTVCSPVGDYIFQFPTLNDSVYTVQEDTNISLLFGVNSSCAVYDGLKINVGKRGEEGLFPAVTCQILHKGGGCSVTGDHCKCLPQNGMYLLEKAVDPEDNTTWVWWNNDEPEKRQEVVFNTQRHHPSLSTPITSSTAITTNSATHATAKRTTHAGVDSRQRSEDVTTDAVLLKNGGDMSTTSIRPTGGRAKGTVPTTTGGGPVAGVVIALLLIGVVIVVVVYRHRTKKRDNHVWRCIIAVKRAGERQVTNYHDVRPHQDRPSGDDNEEMVMTDNVVYGGATAMCTHRQPAAHDEDAILKNEGTRRSAQEGEEVMVMIDNVLYEGGKPVPKSAQVAENNYEDIKTAQTPKNTPTMAETAQQCDDEEEMVITVNVAYEGNRLQDKNYQHTRAPRRGHTVSPANTGSAHHEQSSTDDEVVMIDNILYEGGKAAGRGVPLVEQDYEEIARTTAP